MIDRELVFIADRVHNHSDASACSHDLEKIADKYFERMSRSLNSCATAVTYYSSLDTFINHISEHKNSLVLSLWSGESLRSRRALVPSICEAYGIPYVGADPYIQTICADKHLSKMLYQRYNIRFAKDVIISSVHDFPMLKNLHYPVVVKPNFEGGSIGIFNHNLADSYSVAIRVCEELLPNFSQLIAEEYIAGEEVSVCIAGIGAHIDVFEVTRVSVNGKSYFNHDILGAEAKKMHLATVSRSIITERFPSIEREKLLCLYKSMGKVELIRMDGRLNGNTFTMIELTPDCSLSAGGSMSLAFRSSGYTSHASMIEKLCQNALNNPIAGYQSANM